MKDEEWQQQAWERVTTAETAEMAMSEGRVEVLVTDNDWYQLFRKESKGQCVVGMGT
jgi:hypothetical protein